MKDVFIIGDNIYSPLGSTTAENLQQVVLGYSGIRKYENSAMSAEPFCASLFNKDIDGDNTDSYTRFEQLLIASIGDALRDSGVDPTNENTLLIISSTKGNINLLESQTGVAGLASRISLPASGQQVARYFQFANPPVIICNACISGTLAILTGMRSIQSGRCKNAVIAGADVISQFVLSGFQSFQAVSSTPCRPFDAERNGINLGEAAGTLVLSCDNKNGQAAIRVTGGAVTNDANHISGPSRTGRELCDAIEKSLLRAGIKASEIDFVSAHGTATVYNDEMEALAFHLAGVQDAPVNSLKGYFGHTLGAAGLIETIITARSMEQDLLIPTKGFRSSGVTKPVNVCSSLEKRPIKHSLKTASGFGGCNASMVLSKQ